MPRIGVKHTLRLLQRQIAGIYKSIDSGNRKQRENAGKIF
jgi:hypothetical protein